MKKNTVIISVISGVVLLGFLFIVYSLTNKPVPTNFPNVTKITATDHIKWSPDKKNVLVEYGDFQCPACKEFHQFLTGFEASGSASTAITKKVTFVFRDFPLFQVHPNAYAGAYAAEAAAKQDKFWQMYDLLYQNQKEWASLPNPTDFFLNLAKQLKLDVDKFKTDMNSQAVKNKVGADLQSGNAVGVDSTPSFFYNGKKLDIQSLDQFIKILQSGSN